MGVVRDFLLHAQTQGYIIDIQKNMGSTNRWTKKITRQGEILLASSSSRSSGEKYVPGGSKSELDYTKETTSF